MSLLLANRSVHKGAWECCLFLKVFDGWVEELSCGFGIHSGRPHLLGVWFWRGSLKGDSDLPVCGLGKEKYVSCEMYRTVLQVEFSHCVACPAAMRTIAVKELSVRERFDDLWRKRGGEASS